MLIKYSANNLSKQVSQIDYMLEKKSVVSLKCSDIVSDQNVKLVGHIQNLVGQCPMTDCYFQLWTVFRTSGYTSECFTIALAAACKFAVPNI